MTVITGLFTMKTVSCWADEPGETDTASCLSRIQLCELPEAVDVAVVGSGYRMR